MKKKKYLVLSIILIVLGAVNLGIVLLMGLLGCFMCGKPFYVINGSSGPIPSCSSMLNTDFKWVILLGVILLVVGIVFMIIHKKGGNK